MLPKGIRQGHPRTLLGFEPLLVNGGLFTTFPIRLRASRDACGYSPYKNTNIKYMLAYKMISEQNNKVAWEETPM